MAIDFRTWRVWICFAAGLAYHLHCTAAETSTPAEPAKLMDLVQQTREARLAGDNKTWLDRGRQLLQLTPEIPDFLVSVARAFAANQRYDEALPLLENAIRRGAGFDLSTVPELKALPDTPQLRALREQALKNLAPVAAPETFVTLPADVRPEGITWDPVGNHLYIGSLNGAIWRVTLDGKLTRFAGPDSGLREVLGLKVDAERRLLWAVTGVFPDVIPGPEPKKDVGVTALHAYRLDSGTRVRDCGLDERPTLHGFNDMAIAKDGQVYVTDSPTGSVYKLSGSGCQLDRILQDSAMTFPNGIALSSDGSRLYVAHIEGLSVVDLRTGQRAKLAVPADATANAIDGLVWDGADLLGVQGNPYLERVARIRLSSDGNSIQQVTPMSSRVPPGVGITTGVVVRDQYYMVGGSRDAAAASGAQPPRSQILRSRIR